MQWPVGPILLVITVLSKITCNIISIRLNSGRKVSIQYNLTARVAAEIFDTVTNFAMGFPCQGWWHCIEDGYNQVLDTFLKFRILKLFSSLWHLLWTWRWKMWDFVKAGWVDWNKFLWGSELWWHWNVMVRGNYGLSKLIQIKHQIFRTHPE